MSSLSTRTFSLPDVGEGLTEAEIVRWLVAEGETVAVNAPIVEIETAKSLVELPSPWAGRVERLLVPEGLTVDVGTAIIAVGVEAEAGSDQPELAPEVVVDVRDGVATGGADLAADDLAADHGAAADGAATVQAPARSSGRSSVLVGYGVREGAPPSRRRRHPAPTPAAPAPTARTGAPSARPLAKPPVRVLARELGIDLADVAGSGAGGLVTRADLLAHTAAPPAPAVPPAPAPPAPAAPPQPAETRVPIRGVRRATAEAMVASAFTAPHATAFLTVDATRTVRLLDRLREDRAFEGVHVSPLLVIARAMCLAIARHPQINATWDEAAQEIVIKHHVNLGVAVATPRGLLVPNVKGAQALDLHGLAQALTTLVKTARSGRSTPADLASGTISITNIGVFGIDTGTPILNAGESAILCVGAVSRRPWVHKGKVKPRWVVQLSLSFDHRVVDGDLGSRFLADVGALLERPDRALQWA